jgi:hypothetical protein
VDWEGEIREVKCLVTLVKGMDLSSPTTNLESTRISKSTPYGLYTCEALIQKQDDGRADSAWSR